MWVRSGRSNARQRKEINERVKKEEGGGCHETAGHLSLRLPPRFLVCCSAPFLSIWALTFSTSPFSPPSSCCPQMNSMNNVSSSEDVKPPPGLQNLGNINYQCTSPGGMSKHICSICGDRSSGNVTSRGLGGGQASADKGTLPLPAPSFHPDK